MQTIDVWKKSITPLKHDTEYLQVCLWVFTCLPRSSLSPESSARLQRLQQAIHDTSFIILCKHSETQYQHYTNQHTLIDRSTFFLHTHTTPFFQPRHFKSVSLTYTAISFSNSTVIEGFAEPSAYLRFSQTHQPTRGHWDYLPPTWPLEQIGYINLEKQWPSSATVNAGMCTSKS